MSAVWLGDLKNTALYAASLRSQLITTGTTNGVGVDLKDVEGPVSVAVTVGAVTGSYSTLQVTITESDDNSSFVAMAEAPATIQVLLQNTDTILTFWKRSKRYIRASVVGTAGTNAQLAAVVLARKKITGTGTGYAP